MILSNAEGLASFVLSPNSITPAPGILAIGLTPALYKVSLCGLVGVNDIDVIPKYCPLRDPAGENQGALFKSVAAMIPAVEEAAGISIY